jgi:hypothetical protein
MRRIIFAALAVSLLMDSGVFLPAAQPDPVVGPSGGPVALAPAPRVRNPLLSFEGVVTAVDGESITIRGFGASVWGSARSGSNLTGSEQWATGRNMTVSFPDRDVPCVRVERTRETLTLTSPTGDVTVLRRADQPQRKFFVDEALAASRHTPDLGTGYTHWLSDVRVGDEVYIRCCKERNDGLCYAISILRRPGGRVPKMPGEPDDVDAPFHERMNAFQDFEEKGTPIPDRLLPSRDRVARLERLAPPPREVIPKIPPAKP